MKTWEEFKKYQRWAPDTLGFYGSVDKDGLWFDSAESFALAVRWCCYSVGLHNLTNEEEIQWMNDEGVKRGYSVIHGTMIKKMYEQGLIR